ncbi:MAG TPA: SUMF1/EgtB/PvdO family nonheme iron enzyme [Bryobacteraceae bacterium]|jgi:formylglycine-generating enzyme required for sulfatase activity
MPTTELGRALRQAREQTDALFGLVRPDSLYERPIPERHRILFYIGHVEAFDWNLIGRYELDLPSFHPSFDRLFAFGIDPPAGQLPQDAPADWPGIGEVQRYNERARDEIDRVTENVPEQLLHVAIEHRLMHAETLAYILHQLPYERKNGAADAAARPSPAPANRMLRIPSGTARLGRRPDEGFGWDNEFHAHTVDVPAFSIAKYKITNGEYLEFVREGADPPFFWADRGGRWFCRGMFAEVPLPLDSPVYVTQREADAYAQWRGKRLPAEPEWHRAACSAPVSAAANLDFRRWDPVPVTADDNGLEGPMQMASNGWEWTSTRFAPFPGFEPFPFYKNYSEPFFDAEHYVLKGASPRTAACLARASFRNWFRPSYPYIYATFRLVES